MMTTEVSKTFCALAWKHLFVSNDGRAMPCCFTMNAPFSVQEQAPHISQFKNLEALWNSDYLRNVRKAMLQGDRPQTCTSCFAMEDVGRQSVREIYNLNHANEIASMVRETSADGSMKPKVSSYNLRLSNECNLKCRMCDPRASRRLIEDWEKSDHSYMRKFAEEMKSQSQDLKDSDIEVLLENTDSIEEVSFAGGEPSLMKGVHLLLDHLIGRGISSKIELSYNTNLVRILPNLETYLKNFKSIRMDISIDAFDRLNTYIRYPARWEPLGENLKAVDELASRFPNLKLSISTTVQAYNITRITELLEYLRMQNYSNLSWVPDLMMLYNPNEFSITVLPQELKDLACERFFAFKDKVWESSSDDVRQRLLDFEKALDYMKANRSEKDWERFIDTTLWFDALRKQNIKDVLPEISDFICR
jgi:sulfatase maturation enzyme AslB (radical SAM superfamily)